jgi:hypothetical protein
MATPSPIALPQPSAAALAAAYNAAGIRAPRPSATAGGQVLPVATTYRSNPLDPGPGGTWPQPTNVSPEFMRILFANQTGEWMAPGSYDPAVANAVLAYQNAAPRSGGGGFGSFLSDAFKNTLPVALMIGTGVLSSVAGPALSEFFAAGPLAAGADTLTVSVVGDAALPAGGISIAEVPTVIEAVAGPALEFDLGSGIASAASNSAMVGEEVASAAAAAAGTIPAASSTATLSGFTGAAAASITLGDAANLAKAASSAASTAATAAKIIAGTPASAAVPMGGAFSLRPGTGSTPDATQATSTPAGLFQNDPVGTVVLIAGAVIVILKLVGKG